MLDADKCRHPQKKKQTASLINLGAAPPPQKFWISGLGLNSIRVGGIRISSLKNQKGFGRRSERFQEFRGFQFAVFRKVSSCFEENSGKDPEIWVPDLTDN